MIFAMIFAIVSCLACAALVAYSARASRRIPSTAALERAVKGLCHHNPSAIIGNEADSLSELVRTIQTTDSRAVAVAALNEFIGDAEQESSRGVTVPSLLGRVCLTLGLLLAILAVAEGLANAERGLTIVHFGPALIAAVAGLVGALLCYWLGQQANRRRREYREHTRRLARLLSQLIERRLPQETHDGERAT